MMIPASQFLEEDMTVRDVPGTYQMLNKWLRGSPDAAGCGARRSGPAQQGGDACGA